MVIKITIQGEPDKQLAAIIAKNARKMAQALVQAAKSTSALILQRGRSDISSAGKFGSRWTTGLTAPVELGADRIIISVRQSQKYWQTHEYGAIIKGRPLLWIPLPGVAPNERGEFFQRSKKGNLLLFKKEGKEIKPLRVAKEQVRITKKFHIVQITHDAASEMGDIFHLNMRAGA